MGIIPYIIVFLVWLLSTNGNTFFATVDVVVITLVLFGVYKPYALIVSFICILGILSDGVYGTTFGIHGLVYMVASVLWLSPFYKKYAKYTLGYYFILSGFMFLSQLVFGLERYLVLREFGVVFEYVIYGIYTASVAVLVNLCISRTVRVGGV